MPWMRRWPKKRWKELEQLARLLQDVESLDDEDGAFVAVQTMQRCIKTAQRLNRPGLSTSQCGFIHWLTDLAYECEPPRQPKGTEDADG